MFNRRIIEWVVVASLVMGGHPCAARTWHVKLDRMGDAPTIQAAIDSARSGDDVLVAPGSYTWTSEGASGGAMLRLKPGVLLQSETGAASTILDAETHGRVAACDAAGRVVLRGFTVQGGSVQVDTDPRGGAAVLAIGGSVLEVSDCVVRGNRVQSENEARGGALFCEHVELQRCQFADNLVHGYGYTRGGAICSTFASMTDCRFVNNRDESDAWGARGGAVCADSLTAIDCDFEFNVAFGNWTDADGGAVFSEGPVAVSRCRFVGNSSQTTGQGMVRGGAILVGAGAGSVDESSFDGNSAVGAFAGGQWGGALYTSGPLTVRGSVFVGNRVGGVEDVCGMGGAVASGAGFLMERCTLIGNKADCPGVFNSIGIGGVHTHGTVREVIVMSTIGYVSSGAGTWSCCDLFGNANGNQIFGTDGGGNFSADPGFCASDPASSSDFTLRSNSPCAPGQHPPGSESCDLIGAALVGCSGTVLQARTWTQVKTLFR